MKTKNFEYKENIKIHNYDDDTSSSETYVVSGLFENSDFTRQGFRLACTKEQAEEKLVEIQKKYNYEVRNRNYNNLNESEQNPTTKEEWSWELNRVQNSGDLEPEDFERTVNYIREQMNNAPEFIDNVVITY